ncbi:MAG: dCTP deaminase [Thermoplasmata archaeon]|nr:MAG: dCTP deaminase [Thermoplasmata archaeon]MCD6469159.1 dCTP deaminase [Thermoplasmata archaeon]
MVVLSDRDIKEAIKNSEISIEPFVEENLTPNGYDLTIDEVYIKKTGQHIKEGVARVPPLTWFAVSTKEFVKMGSRVASQLWIRSSYARKGIIAGFGKVDAGFHGTLTVGCFNANHEEVEIPIGDRFCQIVFETLFSQPEELYDKRSGNYQNQRGIKLTVD